MGNFPSAPPSSIVNVSLRDCDSNAYPNDYCLTNDEYVAEILYELRPTSFELFLLALYCLVFVVGLLGNAMVVLAVLRTATMRTATNLFLLNLALADFFVICFCLVPTVVEDFLESWVFGDTACRVLKLLQPISVTVSVLTLTFNSVERLLAICFPMTVKTTRKRTVTVILLIWTVASVAKLHHLVKMGAHPHQRVPPGSVLLTQCRSGWGVGNRTGGQAVSPDLLASLADSALFFVLPFAWMLLAYACVCHRLWHARVPGETAGNRSFGRARDAALQQRRRTALMLIAVVIIFFVCYLPVHILRALQFHISQTEFFQNSHELKKTVQHVVIFSHWLCYFNSAINPIIYSFMSAKFRCEFARICRCCAGNTAGAQHSSGTQQQQRMSAAAACRRQELQSLVRGGADNGV